ncbi:hypothetical protein FIU89_16310 [Roseovarius sp. THAF27]|uniref:calcium-binding protein n=1 Tax=Roseovarius sp. THAF27 TaxID=2587850 RepID=UPI001268DFEF|nr:hypothetical protein [Roseovarius sp. THAF27]QFT82191.1 hypothetical protein FIU89_16310 [Roseovarius sp. THAF27]
MLTIALLSLLGIGATAFLIDEFVDDDSDSGTATEEDTPDIADPEEEDPGTPDPGDQPEDILTEAGFTVEEEPRGDLRPFINLIGTEGDDTIKDVHVDAAAETGTGVLQVMAGDGDDLAQLDQDGLLIQGEDGNDTINHEGEYGYILGGAGDDVLSGVNSYNLIGGAGDDDITVQRSPVDNTSIVEGGDGNDTITHISDIEYYSEGGGAFLRGGDGADSFTLDFNGPTGESPGFGGAPFEDTDEVVRMDDFDPAEDELVLDLTDIDPGTVIRGVETEDAPDSSETQLKILLNKDGEDFERSIALGPAAVGTDVLSYVTVLLPPEPVV